MELQTTGTQTKSKDVLFQTELLQTEGTQTKLDIIFFRPSSVAHKGTFTRWLKSWPGILTWTRKCNDSVKRDKRQEVQGVMGRISKWNHLAAARVSPNPNHQGLSAQAASGTPAKYPDLPESPKICPGGVAKIWNQKRHQSSDCLSLPNPISNGSDWIFIGALFRWLAIWEDGGFVP